MKWLPLFVCLTACAVVAEETQDAPTVEQVSVSGKTWTCYTYTSHMKCVPTK